jgi:hypothetical protein
MSCSQAEEPGIADPNPRAPGTDRRVVRRRVRKARTRGARACRRCRGRALGFEVVTGPEAERLIAGVQRKLAARNNPTKH